MAPKKTRPMAPFKVDWSGLTLAQLERHLTDLRGGRVAPTADFMAELRRKRKAAARPGPARPDPSPVEALPGEDKVCPVDGGSLRPHRAAEGWPVQEWRCGNGHLFGTPDPDGPLIGGMRPYPGSGAAEWPERGYLLVGEAGTLNGGPDAC